MPSYYKAVINLGRARWDLLFISTIRIALFLAIEETTNAIKVIEHVNIVSKEEINLFALMGEK